VPEHLRPLLGEPVLTTPPWRAAEADAIDMARLRTAIRTQGKIALRYRDEAGAETRRVIWPVAVAYFETVRVIVAWCELRKGFRHFRTDRVVAAEFREARYPGSRAKLQAAWQRQRQAESLRAGVGSGFR
jgi:predicted DNA-binding transcriptional regulator YafY